MRLYLVLVTATLLACGKSGNSGQDGQGSGGGSAAHVLRVQVSGSGSVVSTPAGIDCGSTCSASFTQAVHLTATPAAGFTFGGWSGACSGTGDCTVPMTADATVQAAFQQQQQASHQLNLTIVGSGQVVSAPAGVDCSASCSAPLSAAMTLSAQAASGWQFQGWSGACSGAGDCALGGDADATVTATFMQGPPASAVLTISVDGNGTVTSSDGTTCTSNCQVSLTVGTQVSLTATAGSGMSFAGWSGACSALTPCSFTLNGDTSVGARFISGPPPPVDECDGLMPPSLPNPVVATMPQSGCIGGTSDDGIGNYLLGYTAGNGPTSPAYLFFTIQNGQAVRMTSAGRVPGGDQASTSVFSQPSGFTSFNIGDSTGGSFITSFAHDGTETSYQIVAMGGDPVSGPFPFSVVGIDPSGGTMAARTYDDSSRGWVTEMRRFDKAGNPATDWVTISTGTQFIAKVGVALSGHTLVVESIGGPSGAPPQARARWFDQSITPLTVWFTVPADGGSFQFLLDGSIAEGSSAGWKYRFEDGKEAAESAPTWLTQRASGQFAAVRGGRAYVSWAAGQCGGGDAVEVLSAASGKSCGCLAMPERVTPSSVNVGRDGSLILAHQAPMCQYKLYPQLFK